jgi:hypothetical protein
MRSDLITRAKTFTTARRETKHDIFVLKQGFECHG